MSVPTVVALRRYPLKSARGETLHAAEVEPSGLRGDRAWACVDEADGTIGSAKHPRRWGRLLEVAGAGEAELTVTVGGRAFRGGSAEADAALSAHLGRAVRLTRSVTPGARLHRRLPDEAGMIPEWMAGVAPGEELVTDVAGAALTGRFVDFAAVHVVTTGALAALGERGGMPAVPAVRFRPNLVIDAPRDPGPGEEIRLGDVVLRVVSPTPRCAIPGLGQEGLPADPAVLRTLAAHYRIPVPGLGRAACFGAYAEVIRPGRVEVGQRVG